jgi:MFS family permease
MGISMAGINLGLNNIGMKLAPKGEAIVYMSARTMITSLFPAVAPLLGGLMADFFASHQLSWNLEWKSPTGSSMFPVFELQAWDFFFVLSGVLAIYSLRKLKNVKEEGEVDKEVVMNEMKQSIKNIKVEDKILRTVIFRPLIKQLFLKRLKFR